MYDPRLGYLSGWSRTCVIAILHSHCIAGGSACDTAAAALAVCTRRVEREEVRHVTTTVSAPPGAD